MTDKSPATWLTEFRSVPQFEDRYRALQAIIRLLPPDEAVAAVRHGLDDGDSAIRAGSARWLAAQASQESRPKDETIWKSIAARWHELLTDADPDVRFESARGLICLNAAKQAAADTLSELLREYEAQPAMVAEVLRLFSSIPSNVGIPAPAWPAFLNHDQAAVREAAARTLGRWGVRSQELARALVLLLDDEEPFVREEAARSLGMIQVATPDVMTALHTAANDEDQVVAKVAKQSLRQLDRS